MCGPIVPCTETKNVLACDGPLRAVVLVSHDERADVLDQGHRVGDHDRHVLLRVRQVVEVHHDELEAVQLSLQT